MTHPPHPIRIDPDMRDPGPMDLDPAAFRSPLPVQRHASVFGDKMIGLAAGIRDTTTMQEALGPCPGDECITVLDGHLAGPDAAGETLAAAAAGDSVTCDACVDDAISFFRRDSPDFAGCGRRIGRTGLPADFCTEGGHAIAQVGVSTSNVLEGFRNA